MDYDEDPDYLDLDDILAHTQRIMCKFLLDIPGMECLSPDLSEGTQGRKTLLPYWMAKTLYIHSMIDIETPESYDVNCRDDLEADPWASKVDLRRWGPYYYQFGNFLLNLRREKGNNLAAFTHEGQRNKYRREEGETLKDRREIAASLLDTFHRRRRKILDFSINNSLDDNAVPEFELKLDYMERKLFRIGRQQHFDMKRWNSVSNDGISSSQIAERINKRRKIEVTKESQ